MVAPVRFAPRLWRLAERTGCAVGAYRRRSLRAFSGYCIGLLMRFFAFFPAVAPEWHLFAITGFLSSLTTLSTFSAEIVALLQQGRFVMALSGAALHVLG